jgi:hypothetical protein
VSVHLLDAATGRVLYRVRHPEARGPVHAVVCENWIVYHYFNTRAGRCAGPHARNPERHERHESHERHERHESHERHGDPGTLNLER